MLEKNLIVEVSVIDISNEGFGIAKYSDDTLNDFVIFIKNALVGDIVDCKIVKVLTHYAFGIIDRIIEPSPNRITPACPSFSKCGGCNFLNCTYEEELRIKKKNLENIFKINYGTDIPEISPVVPSPEITKYRNKVQYPISSDGHFSFFSKHSHRTQDVSGCVLHPELFKKISQIIENHIHKYNISCYDETRGSGLIRNLYIRQAPKTGETMVCLVVNGNDIPHKKQLVQELSLIPEIVSIYLNINRKDTNVVLGHEFILLWGKEYIVDNLCGLSFCISPDSFYQINSRQTEQLYNFVKESVPWDPDEVLLDLYCGIGTIGLTLAEKVKEVVGIEIVGNAVKNAERNKRINNMDNISFICNDVGKAINDLQKKPSSIIVDPPRKGLDGNTIQKIKEVLPKHLIYISCNPATLTRDLSIINSEKDYSITSITPFDMFPRTCHVECVTMMTKK